MTPEELEEAHTYGPPFDAPIDYVPVPYITIRTIRWILTTSSSLPEQRLAAVDALDIVLERHLRHCPQHKEHQ